VVTRIAVGLNPRGLTLTPDGTQAVCGQPAGRYDQRDRHADESGERDDQAGRAEGNFSAAAWGTDFYTARYSFQGQIGCANCHIDSTFDGLTWNLEPDGFGRNIVDNKLLEGVKGTEPYKWTGTNPNIPTECGPDGEILLAFGELRRPDAADLTVYIRSIQPRPNRWKLPGYELTRRRNGARRSSSARGQVQEADCGDNRCVYCHSGPKGTNQKLFDVGTRKDLDNAGLLKAPPLTNIALTAPYLHDGSARSLEEIWTVYNPDDKHGRTNDLTKDELNDLIEYLRTR
jgi:cytochrome c peroxidase